jgi:hypothetical protein
MNSSLPHPRSERGQAIVLIAIALVGLIAITGLVVDGGMAYADRRQAQNAADSAVLAASLARARGENYQYAALQQAQQNGYNNDGELSVVQVHNPPISGPYTNNAQYIQVIVTSRPQTYFASVIGITGITNTVEAVARVKPAEWGEIMDGYAVISLAPHSNCQNNKAFWAHGEATLELQGGGIWINSNHPTCAFIQQGNGSIAFEDSSPFIIVGGASILKPELVKRQVQGLGYMQRAEGGSIPMQPIIGAVPIPYPPPFVMPKPSCGGKPAKVNEDNTSMSPGYWDMEKNETFPPKGVTTLKSGIYCINGDVRVNGGETLEGTGVLLVVENGSVHFSGSATIDLGAPGGGPFQGLLLYLPMTNDGNVVLNGNADSSFRGTILAPASLIRLAGNDSSYGFHSQIIGLYIEITGDAQLVVKYLDSQNYDAIVSPEIYFAQ